MNGIYYSNTSQSVLIRISITKGRALYSLKSTSHMITAAAGGKLYGRDPPLLGYAALPLERLQLDCYCSMFLQHALRTVITFTQGKFERRTICAFGPKMEFLCANDKYYTSDVTKKSKGNVLYKHKYCT